MGEGDRARALAQDEAARRAMTRTLPSGSTRAALCEIVHEQAFEDAAERCLACQSCTSVCPTCFCSTVAEDNHLDGSSVRVRRRDSCFPPDFSYMHGGRVRGSLTGRYRHWMRHKLATSHDQWGVDVCVGCGRCTTLCPAVIDFVAEASRIAGRAGQ